MLCLSLALTSVCLCPLKCARAECDPKEIKIGRKVRTRGTFFRYRPNEIIWMNLENSKPKDTKGCRWTGVQERGTKTIYIKLMKKKFHYVNGMCNLNGESFACFARPLNRSNREEKISSFNGKKRDSKNQEH